MSSLDLKGSGLSFTNLSIKYIITKLSFFSPEKHLSPVCKGKKVEREVTRGLL